MSIPAATSEPGPVAATRQGLFGLRAESDQMLSLDVLRFIAAMGVMVYHFGITLTENHGNIEFLNYFVDIFFVVSGYVIARIYNGRIRSWRDYGDFMRRRFGRLAPLHYATLAFYIIAGLFLLGFGVTSSSPKTYVWEEIPGTVLFLNAWGVTHHASFNFASWSLSGEMTMYLLFPVLMLLARRSWLLLLVSAATAVAILILPNSSWWNLTHNFGVLRALAGFSFGLFLSTLPKLSAPLWAWPVALAAFFIVGFSGAPTDMLWPFAFLVATLAIAADAGGNSAPMKPLAPLGQLTYSIYMLHLPLQTVMIAWIGQRLLQLDGFGLIGWSLLTAVVVIVAGYASFMWFETPARRWINALGRTAIQRKSKIAG
jgi:peptidoglycan/LPS O-acetylase OafA/YrhL